MAGSPGSARPPWHRPPSAADRAAPPRPASARGPPFEARVQLGEIAAIERQPGRIPQEDGGFLCREAQVLAEQFQELAAGAQPRQRQLRILARGDHDMQLWRAMRPRIAECRVDGSIVDGMEIVQNQHEVGRLLRHQVIDQCRDHRVGRRRRGCFERAAQVLTDGRDDLLQRRAEIAQETRRVIVRFVQREPGGGRVRGQGAYPLCHQRGLAEAGGRGDQGERPVEARVQALDQVRSRQMAGFPTPFDTAQTSARMTAEGRLMSISIPLLATKLFVPRARTGLVQPGLVPVLCPATRSSLVEAGAEVSVSAGIAFRALQTFDKP